MNSACDQMRDYAADMVSGVLSEEAGGGLRRHTAECPACRAYLDALQRQDEALEKLLAPVQDEAARGAQKTIETLRRAMQVQFDGNDSTISRDSTQPTNRRDAHVPTELADGVSRETHPIEQPPARSFDPKAFDGRHVARRFVGMFHSRRVRWSFAAALAASVLLLVGLWPQSWHHRNDPSGQVYAIADVPQLINNSRTLYLKGWFYLDESWDFFKEVKASSDGQPIKLHFEQWYNFEKGRSRERQLTYNREWVYNHTVCDGQYTMRECFWKPVGGEREKAVEFKRVSPFWARLQVKRNRDRFFDFHDISGFTRTKTGQEQIDGHRFDLWQGDIPFPSGNVARYEVAMSASTGQIGRLRAWHRSRGGTEWKPTFEIAQVVRDQPMPDELFLTEPPAGIKLLNTKETAELESLAFEPPMVGRYTMDVAISFTLGDGSVLLAWHSMDTEAPLSEDSLPRLEPGGELAVLPAQLRSLRTMPPTEGLAYIGRHLTWTHKNGLAYEWNLYVPNRTAPPRERFLRYDVDIQYTADTNEFNPHISGVDLDLQIQTVADFETWVRGAMTELSDEPVLSKHINYDYVLELARQVRASMTDVPRQQR